MNREIRGLFLLCALLCLAACASSGSKGRAPPAVQTKSVDLQRYMGAWHVIANIPYFGERGNVASRDVYTLTPEGRIATEYVYRKSFDAKEKNLSSVADVVPATGDARWVVTFFKLFHSDYLILDVAKDYSWALIGQPDRSLGWVLARDAKMPDAQYGQLMKRFAELGYDTQRFLRVPQSADQAGKPGFQ